MKRNEILIENKNERRKNLTRGILEGFGLVPSQLSLLRFTHIHVQVKEFFPSSLMK